MTKRRDVIKLLESKGFINVGGSNHDKFVHQDGRQTVVPRHRNISEITYKQIKKQANI